MFQDDKKFRGIYLNQEGEIIFIKKAMKKKSMFIGGGFSTSYIFEAVINDLPVILNEHEYKRLEKLDGPEATYPFK